VTDQEKIMWFDKAVKFQVEGLIFMVMKSRKNSGCFWAIEDMTTGKVLNSNMEWEIEPPKSQRNEAFLIRTRFDLETAMAVFEQYKMFAVQT
jgi:hypothetical protein